MGWVIIMSKYPPTISQVVKKDTLPWVARLNSRVQEALERESRTLFVNYELPVGNTPTYQGNGAHYGHPNCRGSKLMAHAIVDRLFRAKVLSRRLHLVDWTQKNVANENCEAL